MTGVEIRNVLIEILTNIDPDQDYEHLKDDVSFRDQLSLDSMDSMDIILQLRQRYRIDIPEKDYSHFETMNSTIAYLEPLLADRH